MLRVAQAIDGLLAAELAELAELAEQELHTNFASTSFGSRIEGAALISAGFLFDRSAGGREQEEALRLSRLAEQQGAGRLTLVTTPAKAQQMREVTAKLEALQWEREETRPTVAAPCADLPACRDARQRLASRVDDAPPTMVRAPTVGPDALSIRTLRLPNGVAGGRLFVAAPSHLRDDAQEKAAQPADRLTMVVGSAGAGKTYVLLERVLRTVMAAPEPSEVLITTMNVKLVDWLGHQLHRILSDADGIQLAGVANSDAGVWRISGRSSRGHAFRLTLLNRDKLPSRVFSVELEEDCDTAGGILAADRRAAGPLPTWVGKNFLKEELERVVLAQGLQTLAEYERAERSGRRRALAPDHRPAVWNAMMELPLEPFLLRRLAMVREFLPPAASGQGLAGATEWTHIFVDECQDFTAAEITVLRGLLRRPGRTAEASRRLCIAGDATQSMRLGGTYQRPKFPNERWEVHRLLRSYRLPMRVAEALEPLSTRIVTGLGSAPDADPLLSGRTTVPGPRPVVLAGGDHLPGDLADVLRCYRLAEGSRVLFPNGDSDTLEIVRTLVDVNQVDLDSALSNKGREWPTVIFSSRSLPLPGEVAAEWVYTTLTRTKCLLVLVLWPDGNQDVHHALQLLRRDRLLFWTPAAESAFRRLGYDPDVPLAA